MLADARAFMDVEADAVSGAMEEAFHAAVAFAGFVAFAVEEIGDLAVHFAAARIVLDGFEGDLLGTLNRVIKLAHSFGGTAADDRAGDVAEVAGLLGTGEHIDDDGLVSPEQAVATFVRITALAPAGHNGMGGLAAGLDDGGLDDGPKLLGGEWIIAIDQPAFAIDLARF